MLDYQRNKDDQKALADDAKRIRLKEQVMQKQQESLAEKSRV